MRNNDPNELKLPPIDWKLPVVFENVVGRRKAFIEREDMVFTQGCIFCPGKNRYSRFPCFKG